MMAAMRFQIDSPSAIPTVSRSATSPGIVASVYRRRWIAGEGLSVHIWRRSSQYLPRLTPGDEAVPKTSPPSRSAKSFVLPMSTMALTHAARQWQSGSKGHTSAFGQKNEVGQNGKSPRQHVPKVTTASLHRATYK